MDDALRKGIEEAVKGGGAPAANELYKAIRHAMGLDLAPVGAIQWVPVEMVQANDYNPNAVAKNELRLLYVSIAHDGYTQPVVTIFDAEKGKYVIIDGFHRYYTMKNNPDIYKLYGGLLPVVVLEKDIKDRMASTVRHNRARGKHSVGGMGVIVGQLKAKGWEDGRICQELGLEPEELVRLENTSGVAALYTDRTFNRAWIEGATVKKQTKLKEGAAEGATE